MTAVAFPQRVRRIEFWADWAAAVGLVALVLVFAVIDPTFRTLGNVQAVLFAAAVPITLTVGQAFVVATAGIDLSVASSMTLGAVVAGQAYAAGLPIGVDIVLAIAASTAVGVVNGFVVAWGRITDFVVTLGALSGASGLALVLSDGKPVTMPVPFLLELSTGSVGPFGYSVLVALAIAVVAHIVLFHRPFGVHLLATGGGKESARAMGVNVRRVKLAAYVISGLLAGIASILLVARIGAAEPAANLKLLLNSVAAVVLGGVSLLGGRATILGPVLGAILLTVLVNGLTLLGVSQFYQPVAVGVIVVAAALFMRYQK
ncbi:MAG: ABC transporter permease [Streptosporangiales bacterium]